MTYETPAGNRAPFPPPYQSTPHDAASEGILSDLELRVTPQVPREGIDMLAHMRSETQSDGTVVLKATRPYASD